MLVADATDISNKIWVSCNATIEGTGRSVPKSWKIPFANLPTRIIAATEDHCAAKTRSAVTLVMLILIS